MFPVLRVLVDERRQAGRFLVLGSASPNLIGMAAESLAGRSTVVGLSGLRVADVGPSALDDLWLLGGLPPSFVDPEHSVAWRDDYIDTFLERDIANLGIRIPATSMRRFCTIVAHYHAQTWNGAEPSRALGISQPTVSDSGLLHRLLGVSDRTSLLEHPKVSMSEKVTAVDARSRSLLTDPFSIINQL